MRLDVRWHDDPKNVHALAEALESDGYFADCRSMLAYFERPARWSREWHWFNVLWIAPMAGGWPDSVIVKCPCCETRQSIDWDGDFGHGEMCNTCDHVVDMELVGAAGPTTGQQSHVHQVS